MVRPSTMFNKWLLVAVAAIASLMIGVVIGSTDIRQNLYRWYTHDRHVANVESAQAQATELILNCKFNNSDEVKSSTDSLPESFSAMSFSAIAHMKNDGSVSIGTTAPFCLIYLGTFDKNTIHGTCERVLDTTYYSSTLFIDRIAGAFDHMLLYGPDRDKPPKKVIVSNGSCTPGKRLF
jgi:hypothetical protein